MPESVTTPSQSTPQTQIDNDPKDEPCMTRDEDETTWCHNPATEGSPEREWCKMHYTQYVNMCKKYNDAQKVVDEVAKGGEIPTKEQIAQYMDISAVLEKARYIERYIEAIRVERIGRDIHSRRFSQVLKFVDEHEIRLKVLEKNLIEGIDALYGLQARAFDLNLKKDPRPDWADAASVIDSISMNQLLSAKAIVTKSLDYIAGGSQRNSSKDIIEATTPWSPEVEDEQDLIDLEIRRQKVAILHDHNINCIIDPDCLAPEVAKHCGRDVKDPECHRDFTVALIAMRQHALRIIFYDPILSLKAKGKASLKDFILSDAFSLYDMVRFLILLSERSGMGLPWMKDYIVETLTIMSTGFPENKANVEDLNNRVKILDGWIYNVRHIKKTPNEAWYRLFSIRPFPSNVEIRFMRLCNSYDDMISVLSFGALGEYPPPSFCRKIPQYRAHLSLSGVVIFDMISTPKPHENALIPISSSPQKPENRTWVQIETRSYMFAAIRHEPDTFTEAFLRELKSRPDLFQVIIRSETDPGQEVEVYGPSLSGEAIPQWRGRRFEAPREVLRPEPHGEWDMVARTAKDILYGTDPKLPGYLTVVDDQDHGECEFPVKCIVIMDTVPNRHLKPLAEQVAWAALRAHGYAKGDYTEEKYATASDALVDKCKKERLGWLPGDSCGTTKMPVE